MPLALALVMGIDCVEILPLKPPPALTPLLPLHAETAVSINFNMAMRMAILARSAKMLLVISRKFSLPVTAKFCMAVIIVPVTPSS